MESKVFEATVKAQEKVGLQGTPLVTLALSSVWGSYHTIMGLLLQPCRILITPCGSVVALS